MSQRQLILVIHNVRSAHNVGSMLRTADGLGVQQVWFTGYTPYPASKQDQRLPHLAQKIDKQIAKTSLGAEKSVKWQHSDDVTEVINQLKAQGFTVAALEQAEKAVKLPDFQPPERLALVVGREVEGLEAEVLAACDLVLEIPMFGQKESFNVSVAAAIALAWLRFNA